MATLNVAGTQTFTGAAAADPRLGGVRGVVQNYQKSAITSPTSFGIVPADGSRVGTAKTVGAEPGDNTSIKGTVPPGAVSVVQFEPAIQKSTDPLVIGKVAVGLLGQSQPDDFLTSTAGYVAAAVSGDKGFNNTPARAADKTPTVNAAQAASAGKSLSPQHE